MAQTMYSLDLLKDPTLGEGQGKWWEKHAEMKDLPFLRLIDKNNQRKGI